MSNSSRARQRRLKRSKLSKSQRTQLGKQHFGDKYVIRGRGPLRRGESKTELLEAAGHTNIFAPPVRKDR